MKNLSYLVGKKVKLIKTNDPHTKLVKGDLGIVVSVDQVNLDGGFNQVWIKWNKVSHFRNTHLLALIPECNDQFEVLN